MNFINALFNTVKNSFTLNGHGAYYSVSDNRNTKTHKSPLSDYFSEKFKIKLDIQIQRGFIWLAAALLILVLFVLIPVLFKKSK